MKTGTFQLSCIGEKNGRNLQHIVTIDDVKHVDTGARSRRGSRNVTPFCKTGNLATYRKHIGTLPLNKYKY